MNYKIFFDGYASPKYHNSAGYCVIICKDGKTVFTECGSLTPDTSSNLAELKALGRALDLVMEKVPRGAKKLILGDSRLVVEGFYGRFRIKSHNLMPALYSVRNKSFELENFKIRWVPRKENLAGRFLESL